MSPDPVADLVTASVQRFEVALDQLLAEFQASWDSLTREDWRTLRRALLVQFRACVPLRSTADPRLLQLVKDIDDWLTNPQSPLAIAEWVKEARTIVKAHEDET